MPNGDADRRHASAISFDVSIVTFKPTQGEIETLAATLFRALSELPASHGPATVWVWDNSCCRQSQDLVRQAFAQARIEPHRLEVRAGDMNLGFGASHNRNVSGSHAEFVLLLNQDIEVIPGTIREIVARAHADEPRVAGWEMRQIPYEHPKAYDPASLFTPWMSGAACLYRRSAFMEVGGFDDAIFMYGEDVDLSWRLRARGYELRYLPMCPVIHRTYAIPGASKRMQVLGGTLTNLCLRLRYGGIPQVLKGVGMLLAETVAPQDFPGRRLGLLANLPKFLARVPHFATTRLRPTQSFQPCFDGWNYELRRSGAFFEFPTPTDWSRHSQPLVSILIRTVGRHAWLREALASVANQTYPNLEVVLVEDGPATCQPLVDEFRGRLRITYHALGVRRGRSAAGNEALRLATGQWLGFLDDDDVLFADHVEVCAWTAVRSSLLGVYALSWETETQIIDHERAAYREVRHDLRHSQPFSRITMWQRNFLPIQTVLFHRSLYERHGGFDEDMDQLEDWNLWTRYTLCDDFVMIPKVTSKYRVPAEGGEATKRQRSLDAAYEGAVGRQLQLRVCMSVAEFSAMVERHVAERSLLRLEIPHPRRWRRAGAVARWALARRELLRRAMRRLAPVRRLPQ